MDNKTRRHDGKTNATRLLPCVAALSAGLVLIAPKILMGRYRAFYKERFPDIAARWDDNGSFSVVSPDDSCSICYVGRALETARTGWPRDPYIKENRSLRLSTLDTLGYLVMGGAVRLFGSLNRGWLALTGICGALWVLALYALLTRLCPSREFSLAAAVFMTLFFDLFSLGCFPILQRLKDFALHSYWFLGSYPYNLGVSRMPRPCLTYLPFFAAAYFAMRAAKGGQWADAAACGLFGGSLAYVHTDVWATYMGTMALFMLWQATLKKSHAGRLALSLLIACFLSLPWVVLNIPVDPDIKMRAEGVYTHALNPTGLIVLLLAAVCWKIRREDSDWAFVGAGLAAIGSAMEIQCLTGYNTNFELWYSIAAVFVFLTAAGFLGRAAERTRKTTWLWATVLILAWAAARGAAFAAQRFPFQALPADFEDAFNFLRKNTPRDSVVAALGPEEIMLLPIYTQNKTLVGSGFILASDLPTEAIVRRLRRALDLYGINEQDYRRRVMSSLLLGDIRRWDRRLWRGREDWAALDSGKAVSFAPTRALLAALRGAAPDDAAEVDYLWVGPYERQWLDASALRRLGHPSYANKTVALYPVGTRKPSR